MINDNNIEYTSGSCNHEIDNDRLIIIILSLDSATFFGGRKDLVAVPMRALGPT